APLDGAAYGAVVGERAVHVGRIEEVDAEVERAPDRGDRLVIVPAGVEVRHSHAAETECGDREVVGAEGAVGELGHGDLHWMFRFCGLPGSHPERSEGGIRWVMPPSLRSG